MERGAATSIDRTAPQRSDDDALLASLRACGERLVEVFATAVAGRPQSTCEVVEALSGAAHDLAGAAQRLAAADAVPQVRRRAWSRACIATDAGERAHRLLAGIDPECRRGYVEEVLGGILALRAPQRELLLATLAALRAHRYRVQSAARSLGVDPRTVRNRTARIRRLTGLEPDADELRLALFLLELS